MIKYHGTPFGGSNSEAAEALIGRHAFVSFAAHGQLQVALSVCQSIALDNGAFTAWKQNKPVNWIDYFNWVKSLIKNPRVDFAIIPDVIDGNEQDNHALIVQWFQFFHQDAHFGVPVWHMHESDEKLKCLVHAYRRIAIGSSAEFSIVGSRIWHERMTWAMRFICDEDGYPKTKVHMLRGLDPDVFTMYPFASADSTNAGRNCNIESAWVGPYSPKSNSWRARVIMARTEAYNSADMFEFGTALQQQGLF